MFFFVGKLRLLSREILGTVLSMVGYGRWDKYENRFIIKFLWLHYYGRVFFFKDVRTAR
jgi:hypothetical protein